MKSTKELVISSLAMVDARTTLHPRNLRFDVQSRLFRQLRPVSHWCECARFRVWFRLSVA